MSMNATFVQVEETELTRIQANPSLAETLFEGETVLPDAFICLAKKMQDRVRAGGPNFMAEALSRLDPTLRKQLEERIDRTASAMAGGAGGDAILKLMEQRRATIAGPASAGGARAVLALDKAWHGVHYVLCGEVEPGAALLSQAVLGGIELGDGEGFSGFGPARYFTSAQVAELSQVLRRPETESEAASRFDAVRMTELGIYPGWEPAHQEWVMGAFRRLRDFYSDAARKGRAIVTCLI
jgi:Domain of unknown function (DUF1877)